MICVFLLIFCTKITMINYGSEIYQKVKLTQPFRLDLIRLDSIGLEYIGLFILDWSVMYKCRAQGQSCFTLLYQM